MVKNAGIKITSVEDFIDSVQNADPQKWEVVWECFLTKKKIESDYELDFFGLFSYTTKAGYLWAIGFIIFLYVFYKFCRKCFRCCCGKRERRSRFYQKNVGPEVDLTREEEEDALERQRRSLRPD